MPTNNPPLASVRAREALASVLPEFGYSEPLAKAVANNVTAHPAISTMAALRAIDTATNQLLDEIEGRVRAMRRTDGSRYSAYDNAVIDEALAAIQKVRHDHS